MKFKNDIIIAMIIFAVIFCGYIIGVNTVMSAYCNDENYEEYIEALIKRVDVPVKAVLGKSSLSVNDFINLQVGDIIRLDSRIDEELKIYVGNIKKFTALPGASGDNYAVRITEVIREEQ